MVKINSVMPPVLFFWHNAAWGYHPEKETPEQGRRACAVRLAAAENLAKERGVRYKWEHETDEDRSGIEHDAPLWQCIAYLNGEVVGSLGSIDLGDGGDPWMWGIPRGGAKYARVVEAELALEHFKDEIA